MPRFARLATIPLVCVLAATASAGCVDIAAGQPNVVDSVEKRFAVTGTPFLDIDTFDGRVEVSTWDRSEVVVLVEKLAIDKAAAENIVVQMNQEGDRITVSARDTRGNRFHFPFDSTSARITITAPANSSVDASTGDGRVDIRDVTGPVRVRTGDGSIRLSGVRGDVDASSGDGSIVVDGVIQRLKARSGDGSVRVRAAPGTTVTSGWNIDTGDGSVTVDVPDGFSAQLDATTGDGRVAVRDLPFDGEQRHNRQSARGRIGEGGGSITIRSGDGSIVVRRSS
jgi:hypothetical protein